MGPLIPKYALILSLPYNYSVVLSLLVACCCRRIATLVSSLANTIVIKVLGHPAIRWTLPYMKLVTPAEVERSRDIQQRSSSSLKACGTNALYRHVQS